jgi:hypothetical protein
MDSQLEELIQIYGEKEGELIYETSNSISSTDYKYCQTINKIMDEAFLFNDYKTAIEIYKISIILDNSTDYFMCKNVYKKSKSLNFYKYSLIKNVFMADGEVDINIKRIQQITDLSLEEVIVDFDKLKWVLNYTDITNEKYFSISQLSKKLGKPIEEIMDQFSGWYEYLLIFPYLTEEDMVKAKMISSNMEYLNIANLSNKGRYAIKKTGYEDTMIVIATFYDIISNEKSIKNLNMTIEQLESIKADKRMYKFNDFTTEKLIQLHKLSNRLGISIDEIADNTKKYEYFLSRDWMTDKIYDRANMLSDAVLKPLEVIIESEDTYNKEIEKFMNK